MELDFDLRSRVSFRFRCNRCVRLRGGEPAKFEMLRHLKLPDTISILISIASSIPRCMKQFRMRAQAPHHEGTHEAGPGNAAIRVYVGRTSRPVDRRATSVRRGRKRREWVIEANGAQSN